ncbi:Putative nucleic-acid-binding protein, contains pilt domain [Gloeomargarita lithophora Alchichica-D10]|uniref:Nucleic-acid-binding protein, contains pilt domain n=1 Tax=Gloeomargarita lithophora Alchichica-D10 TaxID=1188229 RepID=A0A1J0AGG8_9CYAN|nr:putative toxin-antitoxin system toxin component, PIN family [Gloeomargarita lithophora]APB35041.1 Putative nucleic-acid-binding protein, contains pilt domain [Gloeomargarita lithophora Alchichica-D10]
MSDKVILDTNLWVYLYSKDAIEKYEKVNTLFLSSIESLIVSTQILGELYNVLLKKKFRTQAQAQEIITQLIAGFDVTEIFATQVIEAIRINARYGYSYWDSLIIATALQSNCNILYSEDMQHDQLIEGKLRIINPLL